MAAATLLLVLPLSCRSGGDEASSSSALADDAITVGSFDFTESVVVAEVYSQALEAAGYNVHRAFRLGPREFVGPALAAGMLELVPEYAGTAAEFHSLGAAEPSDDVAVTHAGLVQAIAGHNIVALAAAPAQDANTFVVTQATARQLNLEKLSDLGPVAEQLAFGGPAECPSRDLCLAGLADVYGLAFREFVALDAGGALTLQALQEGHVDVALMFTTDPTIAEENLVELTDDRDLQPAENITPLLRSEVIDRWGADVVAVIDGVSVRLTTSAVTDLNAAALLPNADLAAVAAAWLSEV
jgi:osmoprotectant transport system substrate-binding protein